MPRAFIIRLSSLGDVVLSTGAIEALKRNDWEIGFLTKPQYSPLLFEDKRVTTLFEYSSMKDTLDDLKAFSPDWIIDLQVNFRTVLLASLAKIPTIRTEKHTLKRRLITKFNKGERSPHSVVDDFLSTLEKIGVRTQEVLPKLNPTTSGVDKAKKIIPTRRPIAAIHPDARYQFKNWGCDNFIKLANLLVKNGFSVVFIGDGDDTDNIKWSGAISLQELVGILSLVDLFVGNDSGPTHIAASLETPTIAIFGPTHPALGFVPRGKFTDFVYSELDCSPCTLHGRGECKFKIKKCFNSILPKNVLEKALNLFEKSKS